MVRHERSYLVRFYAVNGEHRARVTDVGTSRSWTISGAESAGMLESQLVRDDRYGDSHTQERPPT
ncbi:MAG: hypothetical protein M3169_03340 [Candidatus Eremiobacteraeota bacterium]|nr:hypothetical protein [Candidatus Eremiobacteraeota bacterium]